MFKKLLLIQCIGLLALTLIGCAGNAQVSTIVAVEPTKTTAPTATALPATQPPPTVEPSATLEPSPTGEVPTPLPTPSAVVETATAEPIVTVPEVSPTPAGPPIVHFQLEQEISIAYIHMIDPNTGWAIGGTGSAGDHVLNTADGGQTWRDITPPQPALAGETNNTAIGFFQTPETAWVTYYIDPTYAVPAAPVVWRTQDGGQSWQASQPLDVSGLVEIYWPSDLLFADSQNGWLLVHVGAGMSHDYVALYKTDDGGQTWKRLLDPYGDSGIQGCGKTALLFTDAQNGWLTGDCNGVQAGVFLFQTADGGSTWQPVSLPEPETAPDIFTDFNIACGSYSPVFFTPQFGRLVVECQNYTKNPTEVSNYLYTTQDGGVSWMSTQYPGGALIFITPEVGLSLWHDISNTQDGGQTWELVKSVSWVGQFSFVSEQIGWAVARADDQIALVQTTDGGKIWAEIHPKIAP